MNKKIRLTAGVTVDMSSYITLMSDKDEIFEGLSEYDIIPTSISSKDREDWTDEDWKVAAQKFGEAVWNLWRSGYE